MKSQIKDDTIDIHRVPRVQLLKDPIESNKSPCPAHSSTVSEKHTEQLKLTQLINVSYLIPPQFENVDI